MSLRARVKRLEKLCRQPQSSDTADWVWLRAHHPDTLQRYGQLCQSHRGNVEKALRELSEDDLDNLVNACDPERRAERARWRSVLEQIRPLVAPEDLPTIEEYFRHRFQLDPKEWRLPVVTLRWLTACPPDLRSTTVQALQANQTFGPTPWLDCWLWTLKRLTSRIPPAVSVQSMRTLAEYHATDAGNADRASRWYTRTCDECGLLRPLAMPTCPHCGAAKYSWSIEHIVQGREWRQSAEAELASFEWDDVDRTESFAAEPKPKRRRV